MLSKDVNPFYVTIWWLNSQKRSYLYVVSRFDFKVVHPLYIYNGKSRTISNFKLIVIMWLWYDYMSCKLWHNIVLHERREISNCYYNDNNLFRSDAFIIICYFDFNHWHLTQSCFWMFRFRNKREQVKFWVSFSDFWTILVNVIERYIYIIFLVFSQDEEKSVLCFYMLHDVRILSN